MSEQTPTPAGESSPAEPATPQSREFIEVEQEEVYETEEGERVTQDVTELLDEKGNILAVDTVVSVEEPDGSVAADETIAVRDAEGKLEVVEETAAAMDAEGNVVVAHGEAEGGDGDEPSGGAGA